MCIPPLIYPTSCLPLLNRNWPNSYVHQLLWTSWTCYSLSSHITYPHVGIYSDILYISFLNPSYPFFPRSSVIFIVPRTLALHHLPPLCLPASLSLSFAIAFFFSLYFLYAFSLTFAKAIDLVVQGIWFFFSPSGYSSFPRLLTRGHICSSVLSRRWRLAISTFQMDGVSAGGAWSSTEKCYLLVKKDAIEVQPSELHITETHCHQQFIDAPLEYPNKRAWVGPAGVWGWRGDMGPEPREGPSIVWSEIDVLARSIPSVHGWWKGERGQRSIDPLVVSGPRAPKANIHSIFSSCWIPTQTKLGTITALFFSIPSATLADSLASMLHIP